MAKPVNPTRVQEINAARAAIRTPRAAAVAGIVFAVLFTTCIVLLRLALPEQGGPAEIAKALETHANSINLALTLIPFAGIAFLWFMGVVRSRLGALEDQFFSTVFFGSGLLFLAMIFAAAALAGGILASYSVLSTTLIESGVLHYSRTVTFTVINVYAIRMAAVFMLSLGTIWIRTRNMPRFFVFLTYGLALLMLIAVNLTVWLILIFPVWVFVISLYILLISWRGGQARAENIVGAD